MYLTSAGSPNRRSTNVDSKIAEANLQNSISGECPHMCTGSFNTPYSPNSFFAGNKPDFSSSKSPLKKLSENNNGSNKKKSKRR